MRAWSIAAAALLLAACSHIPLISKKDAAAGSVVGVVEYDTALTKFSTVTGVYHQDMCSKENPDAQVHLTDRDMKAILAQAQRSGFYGAKADLTTDWTTFARKPPHCATFRLRVESGGTHNEVRWDCGPDGSNTPPAAVAPVVEQVQKALRSKKEVQSMPWSRCEVK